MSTFTDLLSSSLNDKNISAVAERLGIKNEQVKKALGVAVPVLIQGLKNNTDSPEGSSSLDSALKDHGGDIGNIVDTLVNGRDKKGDKIATHILGDASSDIIQIISEKTGMDTQKAKSVLEGVGPLLLNTLASIKKNKKLSASDLSGLITGESENMKQSISGLFDQDGDGDFDMKDGLKLAMDFLKK